MNAYLNHFCILDSKEQEQSGMKMFIRIGPWKIGAKTVQVMPVFVCYRYLYCILPTRRKREMVDIEYDFGHYEVWIHYNDRTQNRIQEMYNYWSHPTLFVKRFTNNHRDGPVVCTDWYRWRSTKSEERCWTTHLLDCMIRRKFGGPQKRLRQNPSRNCNDIESSLGKANDIYSTSKDLFLREGLVWMMQI